MDVPIIYIMKNKKQSIVSALILVFHMAVIVACSKQPINKEIEPELIANFLEERDIDAEPTESGLYYIEPIKGTGQQPVIGDTVEIYYIGRYLDGRVFDTNINSDPLRFFIGAMTVIEGFEEGVTYMKKGGEAMLIIPSSLAYGPVGSYYMGIPGYTPLGFNIILDKVIPGL